MADFTERLYRRTLKTVGDKGAAITFSPPRSAGSYDETSDEAPAALGAAITGQAVEIPGDPEEYRVLELTAREPITLIFVPNVLGEIPPLGATATWAGRVRTINERYPYRPAGVALAARIIMS